MSKTQALAAFDSLKSDFRDGRFHAVAGRIGGEAAKWGERLLALYRSGGREELEALDPMARFFVIRYRGTPEPADLSGASGAAVFVMAFSAFPYLDLMMDSWELAGELDGEGEALRFTCRFDGEDQGSVVTALRSGAGWSFDLMDLYRAKAATFEAFMTGEYGDFDCFVDHYVAEHDMDFDLDRAWRPLSAA
ncbi:hypothetical protein A6A04_15375 [Paramagnetospirillum marisnigri]|uniref:Uncharacterized protein n=1 Tax=Paramagnetospirillum marisnigri TaxID=1285242 RepID=A0A178MV08_9PROT|nr:hypothetical protein [Paramagnetospirillum marisnigri]OAN52880.1 hypothetical protein A6A04_15375 [Paramagnetospirillum marisnigri]